MDPSWRAFDAAEHENGAGWGEKWGGVKIGLNGAVTVRRQACGEERRQKWSSDKHGVGVEAGR